MQIIDTQAVVEHGNQSVECNLIKQGPTLAKKELNGNKGGCSLILKFDF